VTPQTLAQLHPRSITDVSMRWPGWDRVLEVLSFQGGYNTTVVVAGVTILGLAAGLIGAFAVLRGRAMMSDTLSHATLPGIAGAFLVATALGLDGRSLPILLAGAAATGVFGVLVVHALLGSGRLREDAAMGVTLSVLFGVGLAMLSAIQTMRLGNQGGLDSFIFGAAAGMSRSDAVLIAGSAGVVLLAVLAMTKEFALVCFDEQFARVQGWPIGRLDLAMMGLVTAVTVVGLYSVGLVLIVAMLVIPPTAARFWTSRLRPMLAISAMIGAASGYLGASASALLDRLPTGPVIVLLSGAVFTVSMIAAPHRGLLAAAVRHAGLRSRISTEHTLRRIYETLEASAPALEEGPGLHHPVGVDALARVLGRSPLAARLLLLRLRLTGMIEAASPGGVRLTRLGQRHACRVVRNHRLWEQYLTTYADVAPSHVDYGADLVEHALGPEIVRELENALIRRGAPPARMLPSAHPIPGPPSVVENQP